MAPVEYSALPVATDADYNAASRQVIGKVDIYFDGNTGEPTPVLHSEGLIDFSILEEASADSDTPFGNVTANEISITLYNERGTYSPTNESSPYYGKMRRGVKIIPYFRVPTSDWSPVGAFYVTEWRATVTGTTATVTAADKIFDILDAADVDVPVVKNTDTMAFADQVFQKLNAQVAVDEAARKPLLMSYNNDDNSTLLTNLTTGSMSVCVCDHAGIAAFRSLTAPREVRAELLDSTQVISVDAELSITNDYAGARVTYNVPQESDTVEVLKVKDFVVTPGNNVYAPIALGQTSRGQSTLVRLVSAQLDCPSNVRLSGLEATAKRIIPKIENTLSGDRLVTFSVNGTIVESVSYDIGDDNEDNVLALNSPYIQSEEQAREYLAVLRKFVEAAMPVLVVTVRGNPLLNILDKVVVKSEKYNLNFTGLILRQEFNYNGALSSTLTLLNADILGV